MSSRDKLTPVPSRPRGSELSRADWDRIFSHISAGGTVKDLLQQPWMCTRAALYWKVGRSGPYHERWEAARQAGVGTLLDECVAISDEEPARDENGKIDAGHIAWQRLRIGTRLKVAAAIDPDRYARRALGDNNSGTVQIAVITGVPGTAEVKAAEVKKGKLIEGD